MALAPEDRHIRVDEPVLDPDSEDAVQVPEEADGTREDGFAVHSEPTPNEVFAADEPKSKSSKKSSNEE